MWNKIVFRYGALLFIGLMVYYLIMAMLGFSDRFDFRIFNAVIQVAVLYAAIRRYARTKPGEFNYLSGTVIGVNTSVVGALPFAIFQMFNLYFSPELLAAVSERAPVIGPYVNPVSAGLIIFMEGLAVGVILSYIVMRIVDMQMERSDMHQAEHS